MKKSNEFLPDLTDSTRIQRAYLLKKYACVFLCVFVDRSSHKSRIFFLCDFLQKLTQVYETLSMSLLPELSLLDLSSTSDWLTFRSIDRTTNALKALHRDKKAEKKKMKTDWVGWKRHFTGIHYRTQGNGGKLEVGRSSIGWSLLRNNVRMETQPSYLEGGTVKAFLGCS